MFEPKKQDESSIFGHSILLQTKKTEMEFVQPQRLLFPSQTMDFGNGESKKRIEKRYTGARAKSEQHKTIMNQGVQVVSSEFYINYVVNRNSLEKKM